MGIRNRQLNKNMVDGGQQRTTDLPGLEALGRGGKKEGEVIMVKNEGKVEAYQVSGVFFIVLWITQVRFMLRVKSTYD